MRVLVKENIGIYTNEDHERPLVMEIEKMYYIENFVEIEEGCWLPGLEMVDASGNWWELVDVSKEDSKEVFQQLLKEGFCDLTHLGSVLGRD